jgi:protein-S-isoprenylcysteine O-methyltransferase Ste14
LLQKEFKKQGDFLFRYRSYLPLIILFAGLTVFIVSNINSVARGHEFSEGYYMFICLAVSFIGQLIRIITVGHTPANTSGRNRQEQVADVINVTGIYSVVRHPLYLGNFLIWLGLAMLTKNFWFIVSFILLFWIYYERIMYAEEVFLSNKFGRSYERWAESTPAFMPAINNYEKSGILFSWKKILKNEKNGIAGIFVTFFIFDFTGHSINAGRLVIEPNFWFYAAIIALVFYFILKYLKRKTALLNEEGR